MDRVSEQGDRKMSDREQRQRREQRDGSELQTVGMERE